jgi:hypothetical protein
MMQGVESKGRKLTLRLEREVNPARLPLAS